MDGMHFKDLDPALFYHPIADIISVKSATLQVNTRYLVTYLGTTNDKVVAQLVAEGWG